MVGCRKLTIIKNRGGMLMYLGLSGRKLESILEKGIEDMRMRSAIVEAITQNNKAIFDSLPQDIAEELKRKKHEEFKGKI